MGITPFVESHAEYLYGVLGRDMIRVVDGQQAYLLAVGPAELGVVADSVERGSPPVLPLLSVAGMVVIGESIVAVRRLRRVRSWGGLVSPYAKK